MKKFSVVPNWRLREARELHGWSQHYVAGQLGVERYYISRWERGVTSPSPHYRQLLCQFFGADARALGLLSSDPESGSACEDSAHQQEAERTSAMSAPSAVDWTLPFHRNPFFTGREKDLQRLYEAFHTEQAQMFTQVQALSGLGGIGKTHIAVEYAYRFRDDYRTILWVRAETLDILLADVATLASALHLLEQDERDQQRVIETVKRWLTEQTGWLLVLDNVVEMSIVSKIIPLTHHGHILLTTRTQVTGTLAHRIELEKMEREEGALLLLRRAKRLAPDASLKEATHADRCAAQDIFLLMDGLPLALDQAGAYVEETGCDLSTYLDHYRVHSARLLNRRGESVTEHPQSVFTTFSLAIKQLEQATPVAADLLRLCAFLHPDAIPEELIGDAACELGPVLGPVAADPYALDAAINDLRKFSLLRRNPETKTLTIHPLVQTVIKERMDEDTQRRWAEQAVRAVNRNFPDCYDVSAKPKCQRSLPHALVCASLIAEWDMILQESGELLYRVGNYLRIRGQYNEAEPLLRQALSLLKKLFGPEHLSIAQHLNDLALLYNYTGQWTQAEDLFRQSLTIREKIGGSDHPDMAESLQNLVYLYCEQGRYAEAEPLFRRSVQIYEQIIGPDHPETAYLLASLGFIHNIREKYAQFEPLLQGALVIREKALGLDHFAVSRVLLGLGKLSIRQRDYHQAERLLQSALAIFEQTRVEDHSDVEECCALLGKLYAAQGNQVQAHIYYQRAAAYEKM
jgi:tetratricopeptide (TPR) repeat protein/transcriptional regulator with XRE-family HTH domain